MASNNIVTIRIIRLRCVSSVWGGGLLPLSPPCMTNQLPFKAITYTHSDIGRILNVGDVKTLTDPSSVRGIIIHINMEYGKSFMLRVCYSPFRGWY